MWFGLRFEMQVAYMTQLGVYVPAASWANQCVADWTQTSAISAWPASTIAQALASGPVFNLAAERWNSQVMSFCISIVAET